MHFASKTVEDFCRFLSNTFPCSANIYVSFMPTYPILEIANDENDEITKSYVYCTQDNLLDGSLFITMTIAGAETYGANEELTNACLKEIAISYRRIMIASVVTENPSIGVADNNEQEAILNETFAQQAVSLFNYWKENHKE